MSAGRWLLVLLVAWILWRKAVRPQLVRRSEEAKAVQEKTRIRQEPKKRLKFALAKTNKPSSVELISVWVQKS